MREQEEYSGKDKQSKTSSRNNDDLMPILASARTGLAGKDDAVVRRIPSDYAGRSVKEALDYIVSADPSDTELPLVESVKKELNARGSVVVVNGKSAKLNDKLQKYLVTREHQLPDGSKKNYQELEIEISAVQQGGLYALLK